MDMSNTPIIGHRGVQVLRLLYEHGPLSNDTLRAVIHPPISQRKLNEALERLSHLNLIRARHSSVPKHAFRYLELRTNVRARKMISNTLKVSPGEIKPIGGGTEALLHWQLCAIWARYFEIQLEGLSSTRDFRIHPNSEVSKALHSPGVNAHILPDIVLSLKDSRFGAKHIAVEIERHEKSSIRLIRKLRRLCNGTSLCGVIYISPKPRVLEKIRKILVAHVLPRAQRTRKSADDFLLLSEGKIDPKTGALIGFDLKGNVVTALAWAQRLEPTGRST
jgi:hypothetical protein